MPKNPFVRKPEVVKPEPVAEAPPIMSHVVAKPKGPLDCPSCSKPINHAGPHA